MVLEISSALLLKLLAEAAASPRAEVCGLLFGTGARVEAFQPAANVAVDPARRFEIEPAALFAALRSTRLGGTPLIGHYHSHPLGPAEPSACDAAHASGDGALWLILGEGRATAWRDVAAGTFQAVTLAVDPAVTK